MADWLNKDSLQDGTQATNGDFLRAFIENLWKAVINLLNAIGEWPIDLA